MPADCLKHWSVPGQAESSLQSVTVHSVVLTEKYMSWYTHAETLNHSKYSYYILKVQMPTNCLKHWLVPEQPESSLQSVTVHSVGLTEKMYELIYRIYYIPRSVFNAYLRQIKVVLPTVKKYRIFSLVPNTIYISFTVANRGYFDD